MAVSLRKDPHAFDVSYCPGRDSLLGIARSDDRLICLDPSTGEPVEGELPLVQHMSHPTLSPNGTRLYVHDPREHCGWLHDLSHGENVMRTSITPGYARPVFSPDGKLIIGCDDDLILHVVEVATGETLHTFENAVARMPVPAHLAFRNDGSALAVAQASGCRLVDLRAAEIREFGPGATFVRFSPNDDVVLKLGDVGQCGLFDAASQERICSLEGCEGGKQVTSLLMVRLWQSPALDGSICFPLPPASTSSSFPRPDSTARNLASFQKMAIGSCSFGTVMIPRSCRTFVGWRRLRLNERSTETILPGIEYH